jgi:23S rRNA U2552 (ribose-2'-O)-methylase RlmE/FtsJ
MSYTPFIFKLKHDDKVIESFTDNKITITSNILQPFFSLGFHSFIHRTKNAMSITNKLETKNKFYYIVNPFEQSINDYSDDIEHYTNKFLNSPNVLSRAFYKMWEILYTFDIASKEKMTMAGIAEGPGSFIQAFVEFREKYKIGDKELNDKVYGLTINTGESVSINRNMVDSINKRYTNMIDIIDQRSDQRSDRKASKENSKSKKKVNEIDGDVTNIKTIKYLKEYINNKVDLVTADGGFEWKNENYQEQEAYILILGEIISALTIQANGGSFVLKVFETFTPITIKLIYILASFYEDVYVYKPFFSRATNSEKYIICKGFKGIDNDKLKFLEDTLSKCKTDKFINEMFPQYTISDDNLNMFKYINIEIANTQQIMINNLVVYIKSNNYFGDAYHNYREQQIKANKWWINTFFTDKLNEKNTLVKETCKYNDSEINLFTKKIL